MPNSDNASLIITVGTYNGTAFGILQNIAVAAPVSVAPLQAQGDLGTTTVGITAKGGTATATWVAGAGSGLFTRGTLGDLAITSKDATGGATQNYTASNMMALEGTFVQADRTYAVYTQNFLNVSSDGDFFGGV